MYHIFRAGTLALATFCSTAATSDALGDVDLRSSYSIDSGDSVHVLAVGRQDLSGDYEIDSEGLLRIATLPDLRSVGLTARQLEEKLEQSVLDSYGEKVSVSVRMAAYRPVFVIGEVRSPGRYDFRPGMTALQAVAVAGGFTTLNAAAMSSGNGEEVAGILAQHFALSVQRARLLAEQQGAVTVELPPEIAMIATRSPLFAAVAAAEDELFKRHRETQELKLQGFERSRKIFEEEAAALTENIGVQERLRGLLSEQAAAVQTLLKKGAVDRTVYLDLERQATEAQSARQETKSFLARAQQNAAVAQQNAINLKAEEGEMLESALSANARELLLLEERLKALTGTQVDITTLATPDGPGAGGYNFEIIRTTTSGGEEVTRTRRSGRIQPGDVISVTRSQ